MRKSDDLGAPVHRTTEDATLPAAEAEPESFNALQIDALATIRNELCDELRAEWQRDIERLMDTVVRLIRPGEVAESQTRALTDRLAVLEGKIERQLSGIAERLPNWRKRDVA